MSGCGLRNGEAAVVNLNNIVAAGTYHVTEQVNRTTKQYDRLKHRKKGEYRDVPLPPQVKETIERYAETHGTVDGRPCPTRPRRRTVSVGAAGRPGTHRSAEECV
ncbi:hypothetical protein [Streptomyces katrae]|uniref:hypothetical protein n=1 Tax=Streptomyces katrae TaxID=68223 RepID=UPI00133182C2|nr:hypothetical protein [Streptomyces katrae]